MTETFVVAAKIITPIGAALAAMVYGWTLVGHIDAALTEHLQATFASKADLAKVGATVDTLNCKVDEVLTRLPRAP
jgi:hypothetical protein